MKTIFGALILREKSRRGSIEAGFEYLKKLDANTGSYAANPEAMYSLLKDDGPYALTPWNLADAMLLKNTRGMPFDFILPAETMVPVEPIALVKGGPSPDGAKLFYDFVNSPEQLVLMARERDRLPARTDISRDKLPAWMADLKIHAMQIDWAELENNIEEWMARWDAEVKGKGGR
jgi:iron(III) transport system substrate-binding protein